MSTPTPVPAFRATRWLSAVTGILQVALLGLVHPLGALLLAFDPYHAKYTSQAYLEGIPGFFAVVSVFVFGRCSFRPGLAHITLEQGSQRVTPECPVPG